MYILYMGVGKGGCPLSGHGFQAEQSEEELG